MYQRIEENYKKKSEIKKFDSFLLVDSLIVLIVSYISYIIKENIFMILITILIGIITFYLYIGKKIGYKFNKDSMIKWWNIKRTFLDYREYIHNYDQKLIERILLEENITKRDEVKIIIEHYKEKANNVHVDLNFWTLVSILIVIFFEVINRLDISIEQVLAYLIIALAMFAIYYLCTKQFIDFLSIIRKKKQLYLSLEEKITELYIYKYKNKVIKKKEKEIKQE